jgi:glycosyltransferase involved in cell wall biosynthesis
MRVAIFTDTFLPQINGVTNTLSKIIEHFEANGIEYLIFAPNSYTATSREYNVEKFFSLKFFLYPECRVSFPNIFRIKNALLNFKPDVIQLMTEFNMGIMGLNFGRKYNIPTISNYSTNFSQYLKYYNLEFIEKLVWNYVNWFHSQNDLTISLSLECKELLKTHGLINVDVFSRGVDSKMFKPEHRNLELRRKLGIEDKVVFLYVGRVALEYEQNSYNWLWI